MTGEELAIAAAAFFLMTSTKTPPITWGTGWQWPIPDLDSGGPRVTPAVISQEYRSAGTPHLGVDLMYRIVGRDGFFAPPGVPVAAARAGTLWSVTRTPRGWAVVVDHGPPWATFYQHLETVAPELSPVIEVKGSLGLYHRGSIPIQAGQILGTMGADPADPQHIRHLHFATWYRGSGDGASVDPSGSMATWNRWRWRPPLQN